MKIELGSIKESGGEETPRFEAVLWIDDQKAAHVSNEGRGGCHRYVWLDRTLEAPFLELAKTTYSTDHEAADHVIYDMLGAAAILRSAKRHCRTRTLTRLPGRTYEPGDCTVFNLPFTVKTKTALVAKHPGIVFINEEIGQVAK